MEHQAGGSGDIVTLERLAEETGVHLRTLRRYMDDPDNPMPTHHVCIGTNDRGRVMVSRREFQSWITRFPPRRAAKANLRQKPAPSELEQRVARAVRSIRDRS